MEQTPGTVHTPTTAARRIAQLPAEVIERIAAGEVIERPASVVRELIDNALDARATTIRVEIRDGGLRLVRVADDGAGVPADDLELACAPHTTSKLRTISDLETLCTLGFRGEALASIAAVAELELDSTSDDEGVAATLTLSGGQVMARGHVPRSRGTTVTVRELFAAVPARRSLLRGPRGEAHAVLAVVRAYALAHPAACFTLVSDGMLVLRTPGSDLAGAVEASYGADLARSLLAMDLARLEVAEIRGDVGGRPFTFPTREHVLLVVNGRPVANRELLAAAEAGYRPQLRKGRHPLLVARITVAPGAVDANVHPSKAEVLLRQEAAIGAALRERIHAALGHAALSVPAGVTSTSARSVSSRFIRPVQLHLPAPRNRRGLPLADGRIPYAAGAADEDAAPHERKLPALTPLAQFDATLILAQSPQGHLFLVDQHRAHERILYERLRGLSPYPLSHEERGREATQATNGGSGNLPTLQAAVGGKHASPALGDAANALDAIIGDKLAPVSPGDAATLTPAAQLLLEPLLIELSPLQSELLTPRLDELRRLGLECQPFGGSVFLVRSVPNVPGGRANPAAFAEALAQEAAEDADDWLDAVCVALACRSAIRRGETLTLGEMRALLADLRSAATTAVCPHGSPLLLRYTHGALIKAFEW